MASRRKTAEPTEEERRAAQDAYEHFLDDAKSEPVKYFKHDTNAHDDDALYRFVHEYGMAYYGWYWLLVEQLNKRKDHCYKVRIVRAKDANGVAYATEDDPVGWRRLSMDMSCLCDMGVEQCKEFIAALDAYGLISHEHLAELGQVVIRRIRFDAETYAESVAKKKLGAWKTNRKALFE